jgi:hypothetical protein
MTFTRLKLFVAAGNGSEQGKLFHKPFGLLQFAAPHKKLQAHGNTKDFYMATLSKLVLGSCIAAALLWADVAAAQKTDTVVADSAKSQMQIEAVKVNIRHSGPVAASANHSPSIQTNNAEASDSPATGTLITMASALVLMIVIALRRKRS